MVRNVIPNEGEEYQASDFPSPEISRCARNDKKIELQHHLIR